MIIVHPSTKLTSITIQRNKISVIVLLHIYIAGVIGITLSHVNGIPKDPTSLADIEAAERFNQFSLGWWANPIFGTGDYPDIMKWQIGNKSIEQGINKSRLPTFTDEEKTLIKGKEIWQIGTLLSSRKIISARFRKNMQKCNNYQLK